MNNEPQLLTVTLVVAGAPRSGKSSLLQAFQNRLVPTAGAPASEASSTELLDWLPLDLGTVGGRRVLLNLYAIPSWTGANPTRRMILAEATGAIFVVDSQAQRMEENLKALTELWGGMQASDGPRQSMPLVLYYAKQDLPPELILTREELDDLLNVSGVPSFAGDAVHGTAVLETLQAVLGPMLRYLVRSGSSPEG